MFCYHGNDCSYKPLHLKSAWKLIQLSTQINKQFQPLFLTLPIDNKLHYAYACAGGVTFTLLGSTFSMPFQSVLYVFIGVLSDELLMFRIIKD